MQVLTIVNFKRGITMQDSKRLKRRNRAILCRYGAKPDEADAVFNLQTAGWEPEQVAGLLRSASELLAMGWTEAEIIALMEGAER